MKKIWTARIRSKADIRMVNDFIGVSLVRILKVMICQTCSAILPTQCPRFSQVSDGKSESSILK
jgi:hypothetical protein